VRESGHERRPRARPGRRHVHGYVAAQELDADEVEKADTHRNAAKRALTGILSLLEEKTIPERLRSELETARDALRRTWGDLEAEASEVANQAASMAGAVELPMLLTKAERMNDGRIRWQARANTGEWDLEHERFDVTFWDDVLHNFSVVQEAVTKGETPELPIPILDIAHYSFRLPAEKRSFARAGYPIKLWQDGVPSWRRAISIILHWVWRQRLPRRNAQ